MTTTDDRMSPLGGARRNWRKVREGDLSCLKWLVMYLYGHRVPLEDVPLTDAELHAAMRQYGEQARAEAAQGDFGALSRITWMADGARHEEVTWGCFGITKEETLAWMRGYALPLYQAMIADSLCANAVTILDMPYFESWDQLLAPGADSGLAAAAVQWAKDSYRQLCEDLDAFPPDAVKLAETLCEHVGNWRQTEEIVRPFEAERTPQASEVLYSELGFTIEECRERLAFWQQFVPE